MPDERTLGLYVHIPFCKSKCAYCDFYSLSRREDRMDDYCAALAAHLRRTAPQAAGLPVDTVYFGGGTPTLLGADRLCSLLAAIREAYALAPGAEITLEANPDSALDPAPLAQLRRAGFTRISLGMQSADDRELAEIGRIHTVEQVGRAVAAARSAGFDNLSLDLIYGLPGQTMERWRANLEAAAALAPEHLSCYGLKVEEGTPLYLRRNEANLPDDDAQADMYLYTAERLEQLGYTRYEISNFARPGRESRHNLRYWQLKEYLGFGPGAHSDFGGARFAWDRDLEGYIRRAAAGDLTPAEYQPVPEEERAEEYLMLGLRTAAGISPEGLARHGRDFAPLLPFLGQCRREGYADRAADGSWRLTARGALLSNPIIVSLTELL